MNACATLPPPAALIVFTFHSPDRLARRYAYQVLLVDELRRAGVDIVFLNRQIGLSPEDDLLLQVQGMVAEYERAKILERSRRGKRHAAEKGSTNVLSGAPYGYRYVSKRDGGGFARYEVVEEQAGVVRQIFDWIGSERISIGECAGGCASKAAQRAAAKPSGTGRRFGSVEEPRLYRRGRLRENPDRAAAGQAQTRPWGLRTAASRPRSLRRASSRVDQGSGAPIDRSRVV